MKILDDGDLFGVINAVDAVALLFVLLVAGSYVSAAWPLAGAEPATYTQRVTFEAEDLSPDVAEQIRVGPVDDPDIVSITNVSQRTEDGENTVLFTAAIVVQPNSGITTFKGERISIGSVLFLPISGTEIRGRVLAVGKVVPHTEAVTPSVTVTPSATPTPTSTPVATPSQTVPPTQTPSSNRTETPPETTATTVSVNATVSRKTADSITTGPVSAPDVVRVSRTETTESNGNVTLSLTVELVTRTEDDITYFRGVEIAPGDRLKLTLDGQTFTATVVSVGDSR